MAVAKPVMYDNEEDEDGPITFKRASSSKNKSSTPNNDNIPSMRSTNGGSSNLPKSRVISTSKPSNGNPKLANVNAKSLVSSRSNHSSDHQLTGSNGGKFNLKRSYAEDESSDDSDDNRPLSQRRKPDSVAVQKGGISDRAVKQSLGSRSGLHSMDKIAHDDSKGDKPSSQKRGSDSATVLKSRNMPADKLGKQPTEQRLSPSNRGKTVFDVPCGKSEPSDDSDDGKPLSTKFPAATVEKGGSPHTASVLHSRPNAASSLKKINTSSKDGDDDSDDEKPLVSRKLGTSSKNGNADSEDKKPLVLRKMNTGRADSNDDSEDEKPLVSRFSLKSNLGSSMGSSKPQEKLLALKVKPDYSVKKESSSDLKPPKGLNKRPIDDKNTPTSTMKKAKVPDVSAPGKVKLEENEEQDSDTDGSDYKPLVQRIKKSATSSDNKSSPKKVLKKSTSLSKKDSKKLKMKKAMKNSKFSKSLKVPPGSDGGQKWATLEHNGVIFPPPYKPHGIKMLYNGQPVDLTPEQEEVVTMFAVMKDTDYATKPKFIENFMNDWRQILGKNHIVKKFELCDVTPIYEWHLKEKEKKKQMSAEEKKALKEEKLKQEEKYMWAVVDGVKEKVGNFRVEPPGLFRGRGEHPKMGKLKRRIRPRDITINIGKGAPVPECPIPGERWKEVKHDNTVTWLAFWNDPINQKEFKYVFLAASSSLKGQSDKEKYEKSRLLKDYIHNIRANYTRDFTSKDATKRQIAVATYLIDKLALRAGNEKDDDEADTVGCCTLKVENVVCIPPNKLQFDFLGKDSIRYFNTVEVELPVYKAIVEFRTAKKSDGKRKGDGDDLFDLLDTSKLNAHLKELMPGLTAKVFRTYNASITLDDILSKETKEGTLPEKIAVYQHANKEVAIICNHQRSVSKSHDTQMSRLNGKIDEFKSQRDELRADLGRARKGKPPLKDKEGKPKKNLAPEVLEKKLAQINTKIEKLELDKKIKEDLKTVALGTSKINYLDPRITVAWCKRHEVPIEKIFNKSLLAKFAWAMDVDPSYRF